MVQEKREGCGGLRGSHNYRQTDRQADRRAHIYIHTTMNTPAQHPLRNWRNLCAARARLIPASGPQGDSVCVPNRWQVCSGDMQVLRRCFVGLLVSLIPSEMPLKVIYWYLFTTYSFLHFPLSEKKIYIQDIKYYFVINRQLEWCTECMGCEWLDG